MAVPTLLKQRIRLSSIFAVCALALAAVPSGAKPTAPVLSIPLEDLGYLGVPAPYLLLGDTVLTVHFADDTHLLVTFTSRGLLKRLADAREDDRDQNVAALLIEIPSGKVLARTQWRERDRGQYLWPLGHGRFLLRVRSQLTVLNPMRNLEGGKPFEEEPFLELHRQVGYIDVAPTGDLVSIETVPFPKPKPKASPAAAGVSPASARADEPAFEAAPPPEVQINFVRLAVDSPAGQPEHLVAKSAGVVRAKNYIDIPATGEGYLDISRESAAVFDFDFQAHGGKRLELSPFDTTCSPRPRFVSATEFIAFGCRGAEDKQQMAGFNLKGEETWINAFSSPHRFPQVVAAPVAGRFALSRTLLTGTYIDLDNLTQDEISAQEITVMQTWDGRNLLKINASPFQRAGQNFDLSPNGMSFAVIHDSKVQVYPLPPLSRKDQEAIQAAAGYAPAHTEARIDLGGKPTGRSGRPEETTADDEKVGAPPTAATDRVESEAGTTGATAGRQAAVSAATSQAAPGAAQAQQQAKEPNHIQNGDADPAQRRTPPSLYDADHPRQPGDAKPSAPPNPQE